MVGTHGPAQLQVTLSGTAQMCSITHSSFFTHAVRKVVEASFIEFLAVNIGTDGPFG
jgi:hypothetical protein